MIDMSCYTEAVDTATLLFDLLPTYRFRSSAAYVNEKVELSKSISDITIKFVPSIKEECLSIMIPRLYTIQRFNKFDYIVHIVSKLSEIISTGILRYRITKAPVLTLPLEKDLRHVVDSYLRFYGGDAEILFMMNRHLPGIYLRDKGFQIEDTLYSFPMEEKFVSVYCEKNLNHTVIFEEPIVTFSTKKNHLYIEFCSKYIMKTVEKTPHVDILSHDPTSRYNFL